MVVQSPSTSATDAGRPGGMVALAAVGNMHAVNNGHAGGGGINNPNPPNPLRARNMTRDSLDDNTTNHYHVEGEAQPNRASVSEEGKFVMVHTSGEPGASMNGTLTQEDDPDELEARFKAVNV